MKKTLIMLTLLIFSLFLFSCQPLNNNSNESVFDAHLNNYQSVYLERIEYFNQLSNDQIASTVKVKTYGTQFSTSTGSGVIYKMTETHYYVLTNQHVIYDELIEDATYEVFDYQGNIYSADLVAYDFMYDLAVLKFEKDESNLKVAILGTENPDIGDFLSTIGNPLSQANAITFGIALYYKGEIKIINNLDLMFEFESLVATIPLKSGNSGGPIFNLDFEVVGLVYGSLESSNDGETTRLMLAIPVVIILEFLELYKDKGVNI